MPSIQLFSSLILLIFTASSVFSWLQPLTIQALSPDQKAIYNKNIGYYDYDVCGRDDAPTATDSSGGGPVYILGDSITNGAKNDLKTAFKKVSISVSKINAEDGRAVSRPTMSGVGGIEAVKDDKDTIKDSKAVVIALGTNSGVEDLDKQIPKIISEVKKANSSVKIYWVNVFSTGGVNRNKLNSQIKNNASKGYSVVDTVNKGISLGGDSVHPNPAGSKKFAEIIAKEVDSGGADGNSKNSSGGSQTTEASKSVSYTANKATIDTDGSGGSGGSSTFQAQTNLRTDGKLNDDKTSLHAGKINFYVLYGAWAQKRDISFGDIAKVEYKGKTSYAVFGDNHGVGSGDSEWSEISSALARSLGGSGDGATGTLTGKIKYTIYPGSHKKLDVKPSVAVGVAATALPLNKLQEKINELGTQLSGGDTVVKGNISCCAGGNNADSSLTGSDNEAKALNYFVSEDFSQHQAAGMIGNFIQESGVNPKRVEDGWGFPSQMKRVPPNKGPQGQPGYGIAQWTSPGRKEGLKNFAQEKNMPVYSLKLQLDWVNKEMDSYGSLKEDLKKIKGTNRKAVEQSALLFHRVYEGSADNAAQIQERVDSGVKALKKAGGQMSSSGASGSQNDDSSGESCDDGGGDGSSTGEFIWPVDKKFGLTACWNEHRDYYNGGSGGGHSGMDIGVPVGNKVVAVDGGKVDLVKDNGGSGFGKVVIIKHSNGKWTLYAHLSSFSVKQGDKVSQGDEVGKSGNTGKSSGPHLHFNVQDKAGEQGTSSTTLNPLKFLPKDGRDMSTNKGTCSASSSGHK